MSSNSSGRLPLWRATLVVARRDFVTMVMSKMFLLFLVGPILSIAVTGLASVILVQGEAKIGEPKLLIYMEENNRQDISAAFTVLDRNTTLMPDLILADPTERSIEGFMSDKKLHIGATLHGSLEAPLLLVAKGQERKMTSVANLLVAEARRGTGEASYPKIRPEIVTNASPSIAQGGFLSSKAVQFLLYILTSTMAVMVLSNLAEEKSNRIVEILATAIPMESLFAGKLIGMLAGTAVALSVWLGFASLIWLAVADAASNAGINIEPPMGWGSFIPLFLAYFASSYLFIGAVYLTIGGIAATPRDAQTFAMPASILQIGAFLMGAWASSADGIIPWMIATIPVVSPYVLAGYAAENPGGWIHLYGLGVQLVFVILAIKFGARIFRRRIVDPGKKTRFALRRKAA